MSINQITRISIKNYRSIVDLTVDLPALTVLVGENGSGKSNFIDAMHFVSDALRLGLGGALDERRLTLNQTNASTHLEIEFTVDEIPRKYFFKFNGSDYIQHELYQSNGKVFFERKGDEWLKKPEGFMPSLGSTNLTLQLFAGQPEVSPTYEFLKEMSFYNIMPSDLRGGRLTSARYSSYPLAEDGKNLVTVLDELIRNEPWGIYLINSLINIIPHIIDVKVDNLRGNLLALINTKSSTLPIDLESDGTIRILALLIALYQQPPRSLLALEEPELFIHPGALFALCEIIKEASLRSQVIITTHSPDMIAAFDVNDLRVVERTEKGTQIGVIDDTQRYAIEQKLFKASDLLRIDGQLHRATADEE